jgi:hypothetical protein
MKTSPIKKKLTSPLMEADPSLSVKSAPLKNVTLGPEAKNVAQQMVSAINNTKESNGEDDKNPYEKQLESYNQDYNYVTSTYKDETVEDMEETLGQENWSNLTTIGVDHVLNKLNIGEDYKLLGDTGPDLDIKTTYTTSSGESKNIYQYGDITTKRQEDGSEIETINITATNHPFYGKSFTRTKSVNQERGTNKPIEDLQALLSNYMHRYNENEEPVTATLKKLLIRQDDEGNYIWDVRTTQRIEEAFENGEIRMPDPNSYGGQRNLYQEEEEQLMEAINKIKSRFKDGFNVSTVLNE